jgi:hypothetical protein
MFQKIVAGSRRVSQLFVQVLTVEIILDVKITYRKVHSVCCQRRCELVVLGQFVAQVLVNWVSRGF